MEEINSKSDPIKESPKVVIIFKFGIGNFGILLIKSHYV